VKPEIWHTPNILQPHFGPFDLGLGDFWIPHQNHFLVIRNVIHLAIIQSNGESLPVAPVWLFGE